jgi:hypothetical protein
MEITYKNFVIKKDQYCYELVKKSEYNKLDGLGGKPTGEIGIKEESLGYYGHNNLDTLLLRLLTELNNNDTDIQNYINNFILLKQDLKELVNECYSSSR